LASTRRVRRVGPRFRFRPRPSCQVGLVLRGVLAHLEFVVAELKEPHHPQAPPHLRRRSRRDNPAHPPKQAAGFQAHLPGQHVGHTHAARLTHGIQVRQFARAPRGIMDDATILDGRLGQRRIGPKTRGVDFPDHPGGRFEGLAGDIIARNALAPADGAVFQLQAHEDAGARGAPGPGMLEPDPHRDLVRPDLQVLCSRWHLFSVCLLPC